MVKTKRSPEVSRAVDGRSRGGCRPTRCGCAAGSPARYDGELPARHELITTIGQPARSWVRRRWTAHRHRRRPMPGSRRTDREPSGRHTRCPHIVFTQRSRHSPRETRSRRPFVRPQCGGRDQRTGAGATGVRRYVGKKLLDGMHLSVAVFDGALAQGVGPMAHVPSSRPNNVRAARQVTPKRAVGPDTARITVGLLDQRCAPANPDGHPTDLGTPWCDRAPCATPRCRAPHSVSQVEQPAPVRSRRSRTLARPAESRPSGPPSSKSTGDLNATALRGPVPTARRLPVCSLAPDRADPSSMSVV